MLVDIGDLSLAGRWPSWRKVALLLIGLTDICGLAVRWPNWREGALMLGGLTGERGPN